MENPLVFEVGDQMEGLTIVYDTSLESYYFHIDCCITFAQNTHLKLRILKFEDFKWDI